MASSSGTKTVMNNQKDIIRNYNVFKGIINKFKKEKQIEIEQLVNPEQQLELSRHNKAEMLPPEVIYSYL